MMGIDRLFWIAGGMAIAVSPASLTAQEVAAPTRQMLTLAAGESTTLYGTTYAASAPTVAIASLSSELLTVAVVDGTLAQGKTVAQGGDALVTPIDGGHVQKFGFDAGRLAATLPPEWSDAANAPLAVIAAKQKRQRFWGLLQPAGLNASAPGSTPVQEAVRQSYLGNDVVAGLRREAQGKPDILAALTARRFAAALAGGDSASAAALIDPKPFTDTGADPAAWQAARLAFAAKLGGDTALTVAMAGDVAAVTDDQTAFDAGAYRIRLVPRDRAMFVAAVEVRP